MPANQAKECTGPDIGTTIVSFRPCSPPVSQPRSAITFGATARVRRKGAARLPEGNLAVYICIPASSAGQAQSTSSLLTPDSITSRKRTAAISSERPPSGGQRPARRRPSLPPPFPDSPGRQDATGRWKEVRPK